MLHKFGDVGLHQRVQNIEEVRPAGKPLLRKLVREVGQELCVVLHLRPQVLDTELVKLRHAHGLDFAELEKLLIADEHSLQEVLVPIK